MNENRAIMQKEGWTMGVKEIDLTNINWRKWARWAGLAAVLILVIMLCINISMRTNIQSEYTKVRSELGDSIYTELYIMCQTFDQVSVPGVDVQYDLLPTMKDCFLAARTLNTALSNGFGDKYSVLSEADESAVDAAFEQYDTAFKSGKSTDDAQSAMLSCVERIRSILETKYPSGSLIAG